MCVFSLYRVDVFVTIVARFVVSIRSYLSHVTDKGLKNEHYRCDPVGIWGLGQGWARNAPTYTHDTGHATRLARPAFAYPYAFLIIINYIVKSCIQYSIGIRSSDHGVVYKHMVVYERAARSRLQTRPYVAWGLSTLSHRGYSLKNRV